MNSIFKGSEVKNFATLLLLTLMMFSTFIVYGSGQQGPEASITYEKLEQLEKPPEPIFKVPSPNKNMDIFEFAVRIAVPKPIKNTDVPINVELIALKKEKDALLTKTRPSAEYDQLTGPIYFMFNIDIYGGKFGAAPGDRKQLGVDFIPDINVKMYISHRHTAELKPISLWYWIEKEKAWIPHYYILKYGQEYDIQVTPLMYNKKLGVYWFNILQWPKDDLMICCDG